MTVAYTFEGHENPAARASAAAAPAAPRTAGSSIADGNRVDIPMAAAMRSSPASGSLSRTGGGGGYGDPLTRDPESVADDVREGWVSPARARSEYGVILTGDGINPSGLAVDESATRSEREERRA